MQATAVETAAIVTLTMAAEALVDTLALVETTLWLAVAVAVAVALVTVPLMVVLAVAESAHLGKVPPDAQAQLVVELVAGQAENLLTPARILILVLAGSVVEERCTVAVLVEQGHLFPTIIIYKWVVAAVYALFGELTDPSLQLEREICSGSL
jgi:hypothetical protein